MSDRKSTDNPRKTLKEGSPEDKVKAWLQITQDESGSSKQGVSTCSPKVISVTKMNLGLDEYPYPSPPSGVNQS
jgi:hypothetical protein